MIPTFTRKFDAVITLELTIAELDTLTSIVAYTRMWPDGGRVHGTDTTAAIALARQIEQVRHHARVLYLPVTPEHHPIPGGDALRFPTEPKAANQ